VCSPEVTILIEQGRENVRIDFADVTDLYPSLGNSCFVSGLEVWVNMSHPVSSRLNIMYALGRLPIAAPGI
jgi:hypothetical protein